MDDKIQTTLKKIDASKLSENEKELLYETITNGLKRIVWPVLIKYMPKDKLTYYAAHPGEMNAETYTNLIEETIKDDGVFQEFGQLIDKAMTDVDNILAKNGIN